MNIDAGSRLFPESLFALGLYKAAISVRNRRIQKLHFKSLMLTVNSLKLTVGSLELQYIAHSVYHLLTKYYLSIQFMYRLIWKLMFYVQYSFDCYRELIRTIDSHLCRRTVLICSIILCTRYIFTA